MPPDLDAFLDKTCGFPETTWETAGRWLTARLRRVAATRHGETIPYSELCDEMRKRGVIDLEPHGSPFATLLGQINVIEHDADNPLISAVVVSKETMQPGGRLLEHREGSRNRVRGVTTRARRVLASVVEQLERVLTSLETAMLALPQGLPDIGGFYAWWVKQGALGEVPERPHPLDLSLLLLYVGISPARESSSQTVRGRVIGNHIKGNTGSSTFRFVLASFLMSSLDLRPPKKEAKVILNASDNERLRAWQHKNLRLTWCDRERPWEIEHSVIEAMTPPLNAAGNSSHPFYSTVKARRAAFRAASL